MKRPRDVDAYIAGAPEAAKLKLKQMRAAIKEAAPEAQEKISYGMPYYGYNGRLAYFRLSQNHIGLYIPPPVIREHRKELAKYATATATVRFPLHEDLPLPLIKKLVKARLRKNQEKVKNNS